ncbi:MAG TPA: ABC transporter ATP-binding protein, partial [Gammaproteobacteria bacterium]
MQLLVLVMAIAQIVGVASIVPFMAVLGDNSIIFKFNISNNIYHSLNLNSVHQFLMILGVLVFIAIVSSNMISLFTTHRLTFFSQQLGRSLTTSLENYYLSRDYLFHTQNNSARLINNVIGQTNRVILGVIQPLVQINARLGVVALLAIGVLVVDPLLAAITCLFLGGAYWIVFITARRKLSINGKLISKNSKERMKVISEGLGGIKDVKLLGKEKIYNERFDALTNTMGRAQAYNHALRQSPRFIIESVAFGGIVMATLYLLHTRHTLAASLPVLSFYAMAGYKLMPALQQIFAFVATIKGDIHALQNIADDLLAARKYEEELSKRKPDIAAKADIVPEKFITLENVSFAYPGMQQKVLQGLNLSIKVNTTIAFVGPSGSGKTTTVDLILGLLQPNEGHLYSDEIMINRDNCRQWQNSLGYVPQSIFLSDNSVAANIAFGVSNDLIDLDKVKAAAKMANVDDFISSLEEGYATLVGERGVRLSGGQRQRIGIARALYRDAKVLILDEATSSLDNITESRIMESINNLMHKKTIIIVAHRLTTVQSCDTIHIFDNGRIID